MHTQLLKIGSGKDHLYSSHVYVCVTYQPSIIVNCQTRDIKKAKVCETDINTLSDGAKTSEVRGKIRRDLEFGRQTHV